jgi:hypothetical protein
MRSSSEGCLTTGVVGGYLVAIESIDLDVLCRSTGDRAYRLFVRRRTYDGVNGSGVLTGVR